MFMNKLLREATLFPAAVAIAVAVAGAFWVPLTIDVQAEINAVAVAVAGVATALLVAQEKFVPALLGLIQAGFALLLGLGLHIPVYSQAAIMTAVTGAIAMFVRTQVTAYIPLELAYPVATADEPAPITAPAPPVGGSRSRERLTDRDDPELSAALAALERAQRARERAAPVARRPYTN